MIFVPPEAGLFYLQQVFVYSATQNLGYEFKKSFTGSSIAAYYFL